MIKVKVKKIDIHNFLSFQDEEWDFDNTNRLVLIKGVNKDTESTLGNTSNGSGKSAWSHALMFALFGQLSGKIHTANLKNKYLDSVKNGWKMCVSVEVDAIVSNTATRHWRIVRGLQKGSASIVLQLFALDDESGEWTDISKSTSANTQKFIEENVLFMNFEMYQRMVMLSVDDKYNFFKLNASQKREFVETLFDTSVYTKMYKMMGEDMKAKNMLIQNLKVNQVKLEKTKEMCESEIAKYKAGVNGQIEETKKEKAEQEAQLTELDPKFSELERQKEVVDSALKTIRESKAKLEDAMKRCGDAITDSRISITNSQTTISHHERELNKHKEVLGMICDDCQKVVNKFYSLDVYRNEIDKLNADISNEQAKIDNANRQIEKVKVYDDKLKAEETGKMGELSDIQVQERSLLFQKNQIASSIQSLERKIAELVDSIEDESKIPSWNVYQSTLEQITEVENDLKNEAFRMCLMKIGSEIVSPESIKRNIISRVVSSINAMINANLSELCVNFTCNLTRFSPVVASLTSRTSRLGSR